MSWKIGKTNHSMNKHSKYQVKIGFRMSKRSSTWVFWKIVPFACKKICFSIFFAVFFFLFSTKTNKVPSYFHLQIVFVGIFKYYTPGFSHHFLILYTNDNVNKFFSLAFASMSCICGPIPINMHTKCLRAPSIHTPKCIRSHETKVSSAIIWWERERDWFVVVVDKIAKFILQLVYFMVSASSWGSVINHIFHRISHAFISSCEN